MPRSHFVHLTAIVWLTLAAASVGGDVVTLSENQTGSAAGLPGSAESGTISLWFARQPGAANQVFFVYGKPQKGRARGLWLVKEDQLCFYSMSWPDDLHVKVPGGIEARAWHHVAATCDRTAARVYYDGKLLGKVEMKIDTALPNSPSDNKGMVPWREKAMNDLALPDSQRNNPVFHFNRHLIYNLTRPDKSLQLLAPLAKEAG